MTQNNWQQLKQIVFQAMELSGLERRAFLQRTCGKDQHLKKQVEKLLSAPEVETPFEKKPLAHYFYKIDYLKG